MHAGSIRERLHGIVHPASLVGDELWKESNEQPRRPGNIHAAGEEGKMCE
jgi:hypothetical protein